MNLPVQEGAAVCVSTSEKFQAAYKADRETVTKAYLAAFDKGGWNITRRDLGTSYYFDFEKGGQKLNLEIYDWQKTGVIIKKS